MKALWVNRGSVVIGVVSGVLYGLVLRLLMTRDVSRGWFEIISIGFVIVMPLVAGYLTIRPIPAPGWAARLLLPWLSCGLMALVAALIGWEGSVCIVMELPIMLVSASIGGLAAALGRRKPAMTTMMLVLPFAVGGVEHLLPVPGESRTVETRIAIAADQDAVWSHIVEVPTISTAEFRPRFIHRIGFPRPLAAVSVGAGVGSIRRATFAGGVLFTETVTEWQRGSALRFSIKANTTQIPATTLDEHVTIGGEYFDVLEGHYRIEPLASRDGVVLHLTSRFRLSTRLNAYAGPWTDFVMRSIQESILEVLKARCEQPPPSSL